MATTFSNYLHCVHEPFKNLIYRFENDATLL